MGSHPGSVRQGLTSPENSDSVYVDSFDGNPPREETTSGASGETVAARFDELVNLTRLGGAEKQETLCSVAPERDEGFELPPRLDALGDDGKAQRMGQVDD